MTLSCATGLRLSLCILDDGVIIISKQLTLLFTPAPSSFLPSRRKVTVEGDRSASSLDDVDAAESGLLQLLLLQRRPLPLPPPPKRLSMLGNRRHGESSCEVNQDI